ncbi:type I secretion system permease/ATPase [Suttonella ornithocola]|uniref:Alpha-hemolysin translocation ATP-binding protein HlyB n=1 Tax=Suttonella ornithocola TaxID=279832 RepID=A0A380MNU5_9GAMM|nr:type I secretion system permease/ATPase [Suttonella ornithocola]SUO93401.1 Alpha-hemolysin translocation ATP-binding protein HlyB [Suttonella ornithocola]
MQALLDHLSLLTRIYGTPVSAITLASLTPRDAHGDFDYKVLSEELTHQGFDNKLQKTPLKRIHNLTLPAVILLKNEQAAILKQINLNAQTALIEVNEVGPREISLSDLEEQYLGYIWHVKPKAQADTRSELPEYHLPKGWFWKVIWRFRRYYYQVIITTFVINFLALVSSLYVMNVYNRVIPNKAYDTLWALSIGVVLAIIFEFIAKLIRGHLTDIAGKKADLIISSALFRRVLQLKMKDKPISSGSYANNLRDFESVRDFMTSASLLSFVDLPFFFLFIFVMFTIAGPLAFIPLSIMPLVVIVGLFAQIPLAKSINESMRESSQRQGLAVEAIEGVETLKANNAFSWAQKKWDHYTAKTAASSIKTKDYSMLVTSFATGMQQLNTVALVLVGTYLIHAQVPENRISMGALIACVILSGRALAPIAQIAGLAVRFQQARVALKGVNGIAERPIERHPDRQYIILDHVQGRYTIENCDFAYGKDSRKVIDNLSLNIKSGEKVAILGRIGSGKSTLLKLMSGLYEQEKGMIALDDVDIRQIDPYFLRHNVALLGQAPRLFLGSLRDNMDMARADGFFSDEVLINALRRFGLERIVQNHPMGLDMPIGEDGAGLSGGQRQIVALARMTLKSPSVVLLDEPTNGLDQNTEQQVLSALKDWIGDKTMIVVTHRPQILALIDRIIVMEQGKIVMDGPKKAVLERLSGQPSSQSHKPTVALRPTRPTPSENL